MSVKMVRCTCGVEMSNRDEQQLIQEVQTHAREAHALALNDEQVRAMMFIDQEGEGKTHDPIRGPGAVAG